MKFSPQPLIFTLNCPSGVFASSWSQWNSWKVNISSGLQLQHRLVCALAFRQCITIDGAIFVCVNWLSTAVSYINQKSHPSSFTALTASSAPLLSFRAEKTEVLSEDLLQVLMSCACVCVFTYLCVCVLGIILQDVCSLSLKMSLSVLFAECFWVFEHCKWTFFCETQRLNTPTDFPLVQNYNWFRSTSNSTQIFASYAGNNIMLSLTQFKKTNLYICCYSILS